MKFPRSIRLDASDENIFPAAAAPGEWAVPGSFAFADADPEALPRKERLAFSTGWLGCDSFGRATLVQVATIDTEDYEAVVRRLAAHFMECYGAPDLLTALDAARIEARETADLAEGHDAGILLAVEREPAESGIAERIRVVAPDDGGMHAKIWTVAGDEE